MQPFTLCRPASAADAMAAFRSGGEAAYLAGGHTLIPAMKTRLRAVDTLVDLGRIPGLDTIARSDSLSIGATATHAAIAASSVVLKAIPGLARLAAAIGDPQVRNRGTIGGSVANNDPAADWPAAALALGAAIHSSHGTHIAEDFFQAMFTTALIEGELVTAIEFPLAEAFAYAKHRHPASRYAVAGVAVARTGGAVRVAVIGATSSVTRWPAAEAALAAGTALPAALDHDELASDLHASAEYRAHLAGVMLKQAAGALT